MTTVLCTNLYKSLSKVKPKVKNKWLPITSTAHLYIKNGALCVTTFGLDGDGWKAQNATIPARYEKDIDTCVPFKPFIDWLRVTQDPKNKENNYDQIHLDFDPRCQILKVKAGNTRTEFKCIDAQEFPSLPA